MNFISAGYFQAPNIIFNLKLTAIEKLILLNLLRRANTKGQCWPSLRTICSDCGCTENTARKAIRHLHALGLFAITLKAQDRRANVYTLDESFKGIIDDANKLYAEKRGKIPLIIAGNGKHIPQGSNGNTRNHTEIPSTSEDKYPQYNPTKEESFKEKTVLKEEKKIYEPKNASEGVFVSSPSKPSYQGEGEYSNFAAANRYFQALPPDEQKSFQEAARVLDGLEPEPGCENNPFAGRKQRCRYFALLNLAASKIYAPSRLGLLSRADIPPRPPEPHAIPRDP